MSYSNLRIKVNSPVTSRGKLYVYHNLPSGGARQTLNSLISHINYLKPFKITGTQNKPANIFHYMKIAILDNYLRDSRISRLILPTDQLICFQSWLIKTPFILRLANTSHMLYICHEPPLEFYDQANIFTKNLKQKVVDIIRLPIKWLDYSNVRSYKGLIIVNSNYSQQLVRKAYSKNSVVVYPCISDSYFEKQNPKPVGKRKGIISVGAINKLKGFELLIKSIATIPKRTRPILTIVGNGSDPLYKLYLQNLAKKLSVTIQIKENISETDLINEYDNSSLFAFSPLSEPFGLVVIEAMARGLPVVAYSKGGGYSEILTKDNGAVINDRNPANWGLAIRRLLLLKDKELSKITQHNLRVSRKFTSQIYTNKILKLVKL